VRTGSAACTGTEVLTHPDGIEQKENRVQEKSNESAPHNGGGELQDAVTEEVVDDKQNSIRISIVEGAEVDGGRGA
ncbi:unnamed protein product, partial [Amoebophrya sp. A120]